MDDDMVEEFFRGKETSGSEGLALLARLCREFYEHLVELGFEPAQALELVNTYIGVICRAKP